MRGRRGKLVKLKEEEWKEKQVVSKEEEKQKQEEAVLDAPWHPSNQTEETA